MTPRSWFRIATTAAAAIAACKFTPGTFTGGPGDGMPDVSTLCTRTIVECAGDTLRECSGSGATAKTTLCGWGCAADGTTGHCKELIPAGGVLLTTDTEIGSGLGDVILTSNLVVNSGTGAIGTMGAPTSIRPVGFGPLNGIDYTLVDATGIFRFHKLSITGDIKLVGGPSVAFVAEEAITVDAVIDARGPCTGSDNMIPGPGGFPGGDIKVDGSGAGGGSAGGSANEGGGGGGNGGAGGSGGNGQGGVPRLGGAAVGDPAITALVGGGGGGGGSGGTNSGSGGGGGGAVQLVSNTQILVTRTAGSTGGINAGGCGGRSGTSSNDGGGGGGAGGTLLLEAPAIVIDGVLAVNGGGGGGGANAGQTLGSAGQLTRIGAIAPSSSGAAGGSGAAGASLTGSDGNNAGNKGGGGGGGIGRIRMNTHDGTVTLGGSAVMSPDFNDPSTTCTKATATVTP